MNDFVVSFVMFLIGFFVFFLLVRRSNGWEVKLLGMSFLAHLISAFAMILLTIYYFGGGDMLSYHNNGVIYADLLTQDFRGYAPDLLRYALRRPPQEHVFFMSESSTGAMIGISTWFMFITRGSLYGAGSMIAVMSFISKYFLYRGFCLSLPRRFHQRALMAAMLLPSVIFWSSGLLKEPIALLGFGPAFWGMAKLIQGPQRFLGLWAVLLGAIPIGVIKPYILFPFLLCSGIWFYWHRSISGGGGVALLKQPLYMIVAGMLSVGGLQALSVLFPEFGAENLVDEAAGLQEVGQRVGGGSNYALTSAPGRTLSSQVLLAPVGLFYALFRPLPFDVHNAVMLLNAVEMMGIIFLWWRVIRIRPLVKTAQLALSSPVLMFSVAFCIIFGIAVGVSSTNMGTLSRYRVPMMPFYALTLLVLCMPPNAAPSTRRLI